MSRALDLIQNMTYIFEYKYASVQYNLPENMANAVRSMRDKIPEDDFDENEDKDQEPHITIFYVLSDDDYPVLNESLADFGDLGYSIPNKTSLFNNERHNVLILPVESGCFHSLHKHIGNLTGKQPPSFEYRPHVTVAYLKKDRPTDFKVPFSKINISASEVNFCPTEGTPRPIKLM